MVIFLAFTEERIGDQLAKRGKLAEAAQHFQEDLSVAAKLFADNPRQRNFLSAVVQAHQRLAIRGWRGNDRPRRSRNISNTWSSAPRSPTWTRRISASARSSWPRTSGLGDAYLQQQNYEGRCRNSPRICR